MLNSTATPISGPPHFVDLHVNPGESVSIQLFDGNETILRGPATITMISQHAYPPMPIPVQVPPGHMIQQIVDENGQLRHIILSAVPNNGNTNPSNAVLMPQQPQQQQQPFPYCCCCCYSCTGTTPTTPLPPVPPPPPQVHHNILAFPTQPNRRRLNPMNRTFSPAGKRPTPTYLNNNSIGKSPIRHKLGSTATTASVDGVSRVSFASSKHTIASDGKPYELNSNRVLVGRVTSNDNNCLSDNKHVVNKSYITRDAMDIGVNRKDDSILSAPRPAPPFSYTSLEEHKDMIHSNDRTNCQHFDDSDKPSILLEINLSSSDSRVQNDISADIVEEVEEEEEEMEQELDECKQSSNDKKLLEISENYLVNDKNENKELETTAQVVEESRESRDFYDESLCAELNDNCLEDIDELVAQNSNTLSDSQSTTSCVSPVMQDNQNEDKSESEHNLKSNGESSLSWHQLSHQSMDSFDSINQNERQLDNKPEDEVIRENDNSIEMCSSDTNQTNESINNFNKLGDDVNDESVLQNARPVGEALPMQRSPKHLLPQLQLLNLTYTSLTANTVKLKWTHSPPHATADQLYAKHYIVEMLLNKLGSTGTVESVSESVSGAVGAGVGNGSQNSRVVYQGHSNNCRISHLTSQQQYSFRVRTTSEEHLVVSNVLTITTPEQQPINNKYNKKSKRELLQQQIQQQQHQIHQQQLLLQQQQLQQQSQTRADADEPAISSDQRCAILLLLLFSLFALIVAVLIQQLLSD